jgi:hypothetical protein
MLSRRNSSAGCRAGRCLEPVLRLEQGLATTEGGCGRPVLRGTGAHSNGASYGAAQIPLPRSLRSK